MSDKELKYGLIGAGMMGCEHITSLKLVDGAQLVAMADPVQSSLDQALSEAGDSTPVALYKNHRDMLEAEALDAVIVATPNFTHYEIARDLANRNIAALIEKPLCTTVDDAIALHKLAEAGNERFFTGLEYRFMPPVARFINRVHSGEVGQVRMLSIREHRFPFLPKVGDWNRFNRNTGGTLVEKCCHFFDLMRLILKDEPKRIFASGDQDVNHLDELYDGERPDILDAAYVIVDFEKGTRAVLDLCMYAEGSVEQEEIYAIGEKGKLEVTIPGANVVWSPRDRSGPFVEKVETPAEALKAGQHHGATYFELAAFHKAVTEGKPFEVSLEDGVKSVVMGAAAHQSIAEGQPVVL